MSEESSGLSAHAGTIKAVSALLAVAVLTWWWFADPPVRVGPSPGPERRVLILLHGHGASKTDLKPVAEELTQSAPNVSFILPSAPHRVGITGRTWYPSFTAESQAAADERLLELRAEARAVVMAIISDVKSDGVHPQQIYVGGFSQGASVALDVILTGEAGVGGLVSLSGGSLKLDLGPLADGAAIHAFVSHGISDPVLGIGSSQQLDKALEEGGHDVTFIDFHGGHAVPSEVVRPLGVFLNTP